MKVYFISDLHINHARVLNFTNGEYPKWTSVDGKLLFHGKYWTKPTIPATIEEWNEKIITNWNAAVTDEDVVFCLGDVICAKRDDVDWAALHTILGRLKGKIVFIRGNHDSLFFNHFTAHKADYKDVGLYDAGTLHFNFLKHINLGPAYNEIKIEMEDGEERPVVMSHYPIYSWNGESTKSTLLYGHIHNNTQQCYTFDEMTSAFNKTFSDKTDAPQAEAYNVGCMLPWMDFTPRTLDELRKIFS